MHAMTLKISISQSLPSRYNRAFGLFLSVIYIVCSSILPLPAKAVIWASTQSLCFVAYYCRWFVFPEAWWKGICA